MRQPRARKHAIHHITQAGVALTVNAPTEAKRGTILPTTAKTAEMNADHGTTMRLPSYRGRRSLRQEISETLRGAVISGEMTPGVVYSAPSLAEQFGVSPTPVREALLDLAQEGLVEVVRNKGFRVIALSPKELDDVTELRMLIEPPTIRRITEQGVPAKAIKQLRPLAAGIEKAAARRDFIAHVTIDMQFHLALLELAGNPRLLETVKSLRTSSRIYGLRMLPPGDALFSSSHEHAELLDLIEAGDADGAEALIRHHISHVRGIWSEKTFAEDPASTDSQRPAHRAN